MFITNNDFKTIQAALMILPHGEEFNKLPEDKQNIILSADLCLANLLKKKEKDNKRISSYIADKRKENKNYARGKK